MTADVDQDLPFGVPSTPPIPTGAVLKHPHRYRPDFSQGRQGASFCPCGRPEDPAASRRGRATANYGKRAELAVAREYGGRKVGHAGGPTDVVGATRKVQVKTTRRAVPAMWRAEFAKLEGEHDGRLAILLLRFVRPGNLGPDDYIVIRGRDFVDWYGRDGE